MFCFIDYSSRSRIYFHFHSRKCAIFKLCFYFSFLSFYGLLRLHLRIFVMQHGIRAMPAVPSPSTFHSTLLVFEWWLLSPLE